MQVSDRINTFFSLLLLLLFVGRVVEGLEAQEIEGRRRSISSVFRSVIAAAAAAESIESRVWRLRFVSAPSSPAAASLLLFRVFPSLTYQQQRDRRLLP